MKITIRDLIASSIEDFEGKENKIYTLIFDDGEITTDTFALCIDHFLYSIFKPFMGTKYEPKSFPKAYTIKAMDIPTARKIKDMYADLARLVREPVFENPETTNEIEEVSDKMAEEVYMAVNKLYNFMCRHQEYMHSFCFIDVVRILYDPRIRKINYNLHKLSDDPEEAVEIAKKLCDKILMNEDIKGYKGEKNDLVTAYRNNLAPKIQTLQLITAIGKRTDIDGTILGRVIKTGFAGGLRSVVDLACESRTSTMALLYQKNPLQMTEYFNKCLQLAMMYIRGIEGIDCGNRKTLSRFVSKSDKHSMLGKYYLDDSGRFKAITRYNIDSLVGKEVKYRSVNHCLNKNRQTKCRMCVGQYAANLPAFTNLGDNSGIAIGSDNAQKTLGVKHMVNSAITGEIYITDSDYLKYIEPSEDKTKISLSKAISNRRKVLITLLPPNRDDKKDPMVAFGDLMDFINNKDEHTAINSDSINPYELCSLDTITMAIYDQRDNLVREQDLYVKTGSRFASLSFSALKHMLAEGKIVSISNKGEITVDFTGYGHLRPLLVYQRKVDSLLDYATCLQEIVTSKGSTHNYRGYPVVHLKKQESINDAVNYLCTFLNMAGNSNIIHAELVVNAFRCKAPNDGNYNLPDPGVDGTIASLDDIMFNRSMGSAMVWGSHSKIFGYIGNYIKGVNPDEMPSHPQDEFLYSEPMGG